MSIRICNCYFVYRLSIASKLLCDFLVNVCEKNSSDSTLLTLRSNNNKTARWINYGESIDAISVNFAHMSLTFNVTITNRYILALFHSKISVNEVYSRMYRESVFISILCFGKEFATFYFVKGDQYSVGVGNKFYDWNLGE